MIIWSGTFVLKQNYIIDFALCFAVYFVYDVHCISHWCTITVLAETKLFCSYKKRQRKMWFLWQIDISVRDYLLKPCKEVLLSLLYPNRKKSPCLSVCLSKRKSYLTNEPILMTLYAVYNLRIYMKENKLGLKYNKADN